MLAKAGSGDPYWATKRPAERSDEIDPSALGFVRRRVGQTTEIVKRVYGAPVDEERQERLAKNESLFRALNENIRSLASKLGPGAPYEFICECSTSGCFERLSLTLEEYERVRQDGTHFLLADGHEDIEIEQVIAQKAAYVVVEKDGVAGLVAADDDPRS
jgi:hypothetical protein